MSIRTICGWLLIAGLACLPLGTVGCGTAATKSAEKNLKDIKAIHFCASPEILKPDSEEYLKKCYSITDNQEISSLIDCLNLKDTWGIIYGYHTQAEAQNRIVFMKADKTYIDGDFIDPTLRLEIDGKTSEFEISEETAELIRGYLEKAKQRGKGSGVVSQELDKLYLESYDKELKSEGFDIAPNEWYKHRNTCENLSEDAKKFAKEFVPLMHDLASEISKNSAEYHTVWLEINTICREIYGDNEPKRIEELQKKFRPRRAELDKTWDNIRSRIEKSFEKRLRMWESKGCVRLLTCYSHLSYGPRMVREVKSNKLDYIEKEGWRTLDYDSSYDERKVAPNEFKVDEGKYKLEIYVPIIYQGKFLADLRGDFYKSFYKPTK